METHTKRCFSLVLNMQQIKRFPTPRSLLTCVCSAPLSASTADVSVHHHTSDWSPLSSDAEAAARLARAKRREHFPCRSLFGPSWRCFVAAAGWLARYRTPLQKPGSVHQSLVPPSPQQELGSACYQSLIVDTKVRNNENWIIRFQ